MPAAPRRDDAVGRGKYVYCIIRVGRAAAASAPIGIGAEPSDVHTVHYKDIAAVVSDAPLEVLDPTRENVLAHERVNETVMREHTVIPMSFGTVFKTDDDIVELLRSAYEAFGDVLNKMQNKLEFGLKVLWDRDEIDPRDRGGGRGHPPAEEGDLRRRRARPTSRGCSTAGWSTRRCRPRSERYVAEILAQLRDVSRSPRASTSRSATR